VPERTVLVAHHSASYLDGLVAHLSDQGYHVLGPVQTAKMALALAAIAPPALAVVGRRLGGRRDGAALAEALRETWGVPSVLVDEPDVRALELPA
jgi:DNA-binding response OmpR family regulator